MSNDLEQPNSSSVGVVSGDLGDSVVDPPGDAPLGAEEEKVVPLPKDKPAPKPRGRPRVVKKKPIEETKPKPRGRPRLVKKKPIEEPPPPKADGDPVVADPMFFAGLNATLKMMVQQERRHRLSSMAIV